jgi:hypothetical protein
MMRVANKFPLLRKEGCPDRSVRMGWYVTMNNYFRGMAMTVSNRVGSVIPEGSFR